MASTIVKTATNYAGSVAEYMYEVLQDGADFLEAGKAAAYQQVGTRYKRQLDKLAYDADPIEDYTDGAPAFASGATKSPRDIEPRKMTISGKFLPSEWLNDWAPYAPNGDLTQLKMNPAFLQRVFDLGMNSAWTQIADLFWVGDLLAGGGSPLRFFDGIITKLIADSDTDVVFLLPAGNITTANVFDVIKAAYDAMTPYQLKDKDFHMAVSYNTWKILKEANTDAKSTTVGFLDVEDNTYYQGKKITPYVGFPDNYLLATRMGGMETSNLVFDVYFSLDSEFSTIDVFKVTNGGKEYGYRIDYMADAQYQYGGDAILYEPV